VQAFNCHIILMRLMVEAVAQRCSRLFLKYCVPTPHV
jgi:hypothetical protein